MRSFDTGGAAGGATFKVTLQMRGSAPLPAAGCRGVSLYVWGAGGAHKCLPTELSRSWSTFALRWQVPATARDSVIRVVLNDFDGHSFDVRSVHLYELENGHFVELAPLVPTAPYLTASVGGRSPGAATASASAAHLKYGMPSRFPPLYVRNALV